MQEQLISATIVADSLNPQGDRITTFELVFPRFILAELNTHRVFSKNSASSRAIPYSKMRKEVMERPFIPIAFQKHHTGMQGSEYISSQEDLRHPVATWLRARDYAVQQADLLYNNCGVTKQLVNRLLEPFLYHKVLLTATEFENFFNLRCPQYNNIKIGKTFYNETENWVDTKYKSKKDLIIDLNLSGFDSSIVVQATQIQMLQVNEGMGEIHIMDLAEKMWDTMKESTPVQLEEGEWHIPYAPEENGDLIAIIEANETLRHPKEYKLFLEWYKIKIATARCARLSYQTLGDNPKIDYQKDLDLFESLKDSEHWSPYEHCARAMSSEEYYHFINGYVEDPQYYGGNGWCRNFRGFIQLRNLLD